MIWGEIIVRFVIAFNEILTEHKRTTTYDVRNPSYDGERFNIGFVVIFLYSIPTYSVDKFFVK